MEIIVDLFNQHSGDLLQLKRMALSAYLNGADAVKIQILNSKRMWGDDSRKYLEMTFDEVKDLHDYCQNIGIEFMATVFDEEKLEWLDELDIKRYKIASMTSAGRSQDPKSDKILCEKTFSRNKTTYVSLGLCELNDFPFGFNDNIKYLYCVAKYPTPLHDEGLQNMPKEFSEKAYYGYSDHALGITAALQSYLRGSKVLEKHFTFGNFAQGATEKAHLCSFTPDMLKQYKDLTNEFRVLNGW